MTDRSPDAALPAATRCGFVALIGAPNVGKSTLVNALVGSKVTIVSRKVQTTRALIRGIVIEDNAQIILVDTPGIFSPKRRLDRAMVSTAWSGAHDADLVCVLLDAKAGIDEEADAILTKVATVRHVQDEAHQSGQHEQIDQNVSAETEERVPIAGHPPAGRGGACRGHGLSPTMRGMTDSWPGRTVLV